MSESSDWSTGPHVPKAPPIAPKASPFVRELAKAEKPAKASPYGPGGRIRVVLIRLTLGNAALFSLQRDRPSPWVP